MIESDYEFEQHSTPGHAAASGILVARSAARRASCTATATPGRSKPAGRRSSTRPGRSRWPTCRPSSAPRLVSTVPDQKHTVVTAGYGTFDDKTTEGNRYVMASDYVTAARTPDGSLVMAYLPSLRTVSVDMTSLPAPARHAGTTRAEARTRRWRDLRCRIQASMRSPLRETTGTGTGNGCWYWRRRRPRKVSGARRSRTPFADAPWTGRPSTRGFTCGCG